MQSLLLPHDPKNASVKLQRTKRWLKTPSSIQLYHSNLSILATLYCPIYRQHDSSLYLYQATPYSLMTNDPHRYLTINFFSFDSVCSMSIFISSSLYSCHTLPWCLLQQSRIPTMYTLCIFVRHQLYRPIPTCIHVSSLYPCISAELVFVSFIATLSSRVNVS